MKPERWRQVTDIFQSAIARPAEERAAFLARECAGDDPLRREVESLISSHKGAGDFIDAPAYEVGAGLLGDAPAQASAGSVVGPYKIISLLGAGGMGEVYLAEDARLGRRVALKLLPVGIVRDDGRVLRFQQEARAASALNHANILSIYDTGTTEDGVPYVVSELLEGETLRERMAGGVALPARKAADYALQIVRGLAAAHSKGIVHRDLKPENLFVTTDGRVKILDFGIAKLTARRADGAVEGEAPTMLVKTEPGLVIGTAGYMSPEQARGTAADHRSDIFSFGCVLYEMLAGRHPDPPGGRPDPRDCSNAQCRASDALRHAQIRPGDRQVEGEGM